MDQLDPTVHSDGGQNIDGSLSSELPSSSPRKRTRDSESTSQRQKREKAAARQRRKRQRDRSSTGIIVAFPPTDDMQQPQQQHQPPQTSAPDFSGEILTPEEAARRDRVRAAARERQRKHRQLVKQRKMRELGLDMGNEIMPGMEEVHYRVNADGQYQQVLPHELLPHMNHHEPPFPQGQPLGGQTFASTLLLSFSCAPLLKQHLLRSLVMTNEELASLEPIIAEAWDRWDHQRRMHYAEHAAKAGGPGMSGPPGFGSVDMGEHTGHPFANGDPSQPSPNDFRARFHRSLVAPSPFRSFTTETQTSATISTPTSAGSGPTTDPIDPHLNGTVNTAES